MRISSIDGDTELQAKLFIAIGYRVILLNNTWFEGSLNNGCLEWLFLLNQLISSWPNSITTTVHALMVNFFLLLGIICTRKENGRRFTRKQFPSKIAYAITIHKSQGLTLEMIVIDLGDREFATG